MAPEAPTLVRDRDPGSVPTGPNHLISVVGECPWGPEEETILLGWERAIRVGGLRGRLIRRLWIRGRRFQRGQRHEHRAVQAQIL